MWGRTVLADNLLASEKNVTLSGDIAYNREYSV